MERTDAEYCSRISFAPPATPPRRLRARRNLLKRINVIPPVQSWLQKYIGSHSPQITSRTSRILSHKRGVSRSSRTRDGMRWTRQRQARNVMAGRVDEACERSNGALTNDVAVYGEVVWS